MLNNKTEYSSDEDTVEIVKTRAQLKKDESVIYVDIENEPIKALTIRVMHTLKRNIFDWYKIYARGKANAKAA